MDIKKADSDQYQAVRDFYYSLIDAIDGLEHTVEWKKDIYPSPDFIRESISNGNLYIGIEDEKIISAMVMNHECNEAYKEFPWPTIAEEDEISVIHALGVHPSQTRKGYASEMVKYAITTARENHQKVIRLDVLKGNIAAEKLYGSLDFQYLQTIQMFYEDTGWKDFMLYEYKV